MERESFENEGIAALMNAHFVCVKVDREERPDLDAIYMQATLALNHGQGGWPMTVFLTPEQRPFFAGTYFPPVDRWGRPGFATLLERLAGLWREHRDALETQAGQVGEHLRAQARAAAPRALGHEEITAAAARFAEDFDAAHGGFGRAPKFPPATALGLLLRHHRRAGDAQALHMVRATLDGMARGGLYDHVGGGFARYATDARWLVPHFEKMLYDNALLARAYLEGFQVTGEPTDRRVAAETLDYVLREMTGPEGGFYSATDADADGEEGKFFVWTPADIAAVLDAEAARRFCAYYDITPEGNWEGRNIPNTPRTLAEVASRLGVPPDDLRRSLDAARARVYEARQRRVPPGLDDKILAAWNGLMIGALAEGFRVLGDGRYLAAGERAAGFLLDALGRPDGGLLRTWRAGRAHAPACLEDYAYLGEGLLDLYEAGGDVRWITAATRLAERLLADFAADDGGGFYSTARDHETLIVRHRDGQDGATPSPNAAAAALLARLAYHLDRPELRAAAARAIAAHGRTIAAHPQAFAKSLAVVDFLLAGPVELALIGQPGAPDLEALRCEVARHYLPNRIVAHHDPTAGPPPALPLLAGKGPVGGRAALYVCRDFACGAPVTDPAHVASALAGSRAGAGAPAVPAFVGGRRAGRATPEGTAASAARFGGAPGAYVPFATTGLAVSRAGFGGYRVDDETAEHRAALEAALLGGVNLIDTSTNYTDGGSERLVGAVVDDLARHGRLRREEVVVVSKIGYVQGGNLALVRERAAAGRPFPEVVPYAESCWHCIHPEFLDDQLERSLARLGLEALDVCLLHNPEYVLAHAQPQGAEALAAVRDEFYRRLGAAFRFFEAQVAAGRIQWYGVSSNTAAAPVADPEATSLARMLAAARAAGGSGHHFRVLQLPLNLFESDAVGAPGAAGPDGAGAVLELAQREGIAVLANRPLNAIVGGRMVRLADVAVEPAGVGAEEELRVVGALEAEFRAEIAPGIRLAAATGGGSGAAADLFRWADRLAPVWGRVEGLEHWRQIEAQVAAHVTHVVRALDAGLGEALAARWRAWRERYLGALPRLLAACGHEAARRSEAVARALVARIDPLLPAERRAERLARKALWVVASTPGVTAVLNGMRTPGYVADALGILGWPPLAAVRPVYDAVAAAGVPGGTPRG